MGDWRFYAQRPETGLWLDTNVQLAKPELTWALSAPNSGQALVPAGMDVSPIAEDGRSTWGKMDTLLFGEEDGDLGWVGICTAANPDKEGLHLEFIGTSGWLSGVPYSDVYSSWKVNTFDVVRHLIHHAKGYKPGFDLITPSHNSQWSVGDVQPPDRPRRPHRRKGQKISDWKNSDRYKAWLDDVSKWLDKYGDREKFEFGWYEAPYVGEEIDSLAREQGFEYRERVSWDDKGNLIPKFYFDFADDMTRRRDDIAFVDGVNLAQPLDPKDGNEKFANRVIALGAGEGRKMRRAEAGQADGRLYQAQYVQYKSVRNTSRLANLAQTEYRVLNNNDPKLDNIVVWDVPGFADVGSLRVGDEVKVTSENATPTINSWVRVKKITRDPTASVAVVGVEVTR